MSKTPEQELKAAEVELDFRLSRYEDAIRKEEQLKADVENAKRQRIEAKVALEESIEARVKLAETRGADDAKV